MGSQIRVGAVGYLNTKPLIEGLEEFLPNCQISLDLPSRLADAMHAGQVDVGLIPVAEYFRAKNYSMVPGLGITSHGPVGSVLLLSRNGLGNLKNLGLDEGSRTSAALAKILLWKKLGSLPAFHNFPIQQVLVPETTDGLLLIGDRAMGAIPDGFEINWDLGEVWAEEFGLPFVYAVWAIRPGVSLSSRQVDAFHAAFQRGRSKIQEIAKRESKAHGLSESAIIHYLTHQIGYEVRAEELKGLRLFGEMLADFEARQNTIKITER